jgi:hypothetical protein
MKSAAMKVVYHDGWWEVRNGESVVNSPPARTMGNLHELHIPPDADEPTDWACRREFGMRYDAYREGPVWEDGTKEVLDALGAVQRYFACDNPEEAWIHSVRADLLEARCAK